MTVAAPLRRTKEGEGRRAGIPPVRCGARRDGKPCRQWALVGQGVCRMHGGVSPNALAANDRRVGGEQLLRARLGAEADLPLDAAVLLAMNDAKMMYLDARRVEGPLTVERVERIADAMRYFLTVQRLGRELGVDEKVALRGEQYAAVLVRGAGLVLNAVRAPWRRSARTTSWSCERGCATASRRTCAASRRSTTPRPSWGCPCASATCRLRSCPAGPPPRPG